MDLTVGAAGATPLLVVSGLGRADVVKRLLAAGADPGRVDKLEGVTPLMIAISQGHEAVIGTNIWLDPSRYEGGCSLPAKEGSGMAYKQHTNEIGPKHLHLILL